MYPRACAAFSGGDGKVRSLKDLRRMVSSSVSAKVFSAVAEPVATLRCDAAFEPGSLESPPPLDFPPEDHPSYVAYWQ